MMRVVSHFGSMAVAGYTIALRIMFFSLMPSWGISNAAATLVGQNLGHESLTGPGSRLDHRSGEYRLPLGLIGFVLAWMPHRFVGLFIHDAEVLRYGSECLRILSLGFMAYGLAW